MSAPGSATSRAIKALQSAGLRALTVRRLSRGGVPGGGGARRVVHAGDGVGVLDAHLALETVGVATSRSLSWVKRATWLTPFSSIWASLAHLLWSAIWCLRRAAPPATPPRACVAVLVLAARDEFVENMVMGTLDAAAR